MVTTVSAYVVEVLDGDTFKTRAGDYVRLANVCAPEKGQPGWAQARDLLAKLVLNKTVTMHQVGTSHGRIVADVWVGDTHVNAVMRRNGYTCS